MLGDSPVCWNTIWELEEPKSTEFNLFNLGFCILCPSCLDTPHYHILMPWSLRDIGSMLSFSLILYSFPKNNAVTHTHTRSPDNELRRITNYPSVRDLLKSHPPFFLPVCCINHDYTQSFPSLISTTSQAPYTWLILHPQEMGTSC